MPRSDLSQTWPWLHHLLEQVTQYQVQMCMPSTPYLASSFITYVSGERLVVFPFSLDSKSCTKVCRSELGLEQQYRLPPLNILIDTGLFLRSVDVVSPCQWSHLYALTCSSDYSVIYLFIYFCKVCPNVCPECLVCDPWPFFISGHRMLMCIYSCL